MATDFFQSAYERMRKGEFEEEPVDIHTFVEGADYLDQPELSDVQYDCINASTQIFRLDTLVNLYEGDEEKALKRFKQTCFEVILQLGKGSGKDYISTISCAYIVYQLLCLKDPARYYKKPKNNPIDILNIAINAVQANNVFFKGFRNLIEGSPWFNDGPQGKRYYLKQGSIEFDKNITVHSGHSEREAWEGYNTFAVFLDEIAGFAIESTSGFEGAKTAPEIYKMYKASVRSRFSDFGKLVSLSFPRFKDDFIQTLYNEAIADKEVTPMEHTLYRDPDDPDSPEFNVVWDHDVIVRYSRPKVFALKRCTFEVNPTKFIEDYTDDFFTNPGDAYGRVCCQPSNLEHGYFKNMAAVEKAFSGRNGVDTDGIFSVNFKPKDNVNYYIHVDLAQKRDRCAVALAHVEKWVEVGFGAKFGVKESHPYVVVDALRWWQPTKNKSVDFTDVREYIVSLRRKGFNIRLCTFDRWNSHDTMNILTNSHGIKTDILSVAKKHYDDFLMVTYDERLRGPNEPDLIKELGELMEVRGKIEHPSKGYKDLSDAVCGAIYNCSVHEVRSREETVEALTYDETRRRAVSEERERREREMRERGVIHAPGEGTRPEMPRELREWASGVRVL